MTRLVAAVCLAIALGTVAPARAEPRAEAVALFDQGIKDLKAGRIEQACAALKASLELVKDSGTKGALARCHGLAGRVATAWLLWRELADTAPSAALRTDAAAQASKLVPRLPRYTITVARQPGEVVVEINGRQVSADVPVAVPIDPGTLSVTAVRRARDRTASEPWAHDYVATEGQTVVIDVPVLAPLAEQVVAPRPAPARDHEAADRRRTRHIVAIAIGGVALGAAGAGTWFGLSARKHNDDAKRVCGGAVERCAVEQVDAAKGYVRDARSAATLSTIGFGVAGAAALTAVIVWATAPSAERKTVTVSPVVGADQVGLAFGATF